MKIEVTKYESGSGVDQSEVNYFSQLPRSVISTLDLTDYLIEGGLGEISYAANKVDSDNGFYLEAGEVKIKCTNILDGWGSLGEYISLSETSLLEYFDFYNTNSKYFWKVNIWNDERALPIWAGIIKRENVSMGNRPDEIVEINAVSMDKEFSEYFSGKTLLGFDSFEVVSPLISGSDGLPLKGLQWARLVNVLERNFPGVAFNWSNDGSHFINLYYVADKSYIYAEITTPLINGSKTLTIKAGYDPFVLQEIDRFTWLHDVCKGMGWKLSFQNETVVMENRKDATTATVNLDYETDFIQHGVQSLELTNIQTVIINDGEYYGGDNTELEESTATNIIDDEDTYHYIGGFDAKIYSDSFGTNYNYNTPFRRLETEFGTVYARKFEDWYMMKKAPDQTNNKTMFNLYINMNPGGVFDYQKFIGTDSTSITLDLITNSSYPTSLDIDNARNSDGNFYGNGNSYSSAHDAGNNGVYMYGNPCHALVRFDTTALRLETYDIYTNTEQFQENFSTITGTGNKLHLQVTVNEVLDSIDAIYTIANYPYKEISGWRFAVIDASVDLINQTTTLKLVGNG